MKKWHNKDNNCCTIPVTSHIMLVFCVDDIYYFRVFEQNGGQAQSKLLGHFANTRNISSIYESWIRALAERTEFVRLIYQGVSGDSVLDDRVVTIILYPRKFRLLTETPKIVPIATLWTNSARLIRNYALRV